MADTADSKKGKKIRQSRPDSRFVMLNFRVNEEELQAIQTRAALAGLGENISEFIRRAALGLTDKTPPPPAWDRRVLGRLGRISNNVTQILGHAEEQHFEDLAAAARSLLDRIVNLSRSIENGETPPPSDLGQGLFTALEGPGQSINRAAKSMNATGDMARADQALSQFAAVTEILVEVQHVC